MRHMHNQAREKDKESALLPHHLQATEAAIIAAAQQHSLMDKYRQELMRLGMPPGLAPPPPPPLPHHPAGFMPGVPAQAQAQPNPAHFGPLSLAAPNSSSGGGAPPLSPLLTREAFNAAAAANPLLSPKSSMPPMPPNMNEAEFLNIMRAMTAGNNNNNNNSPFSGGMPPFPPLAKNPNGLPPFLQQFFDSISQTSGAKKEQPLARAAIARDNASSVSPNSSASKKPRTLSPTEASQEIRANSPNKETALEFTNKKETESSEAKEAAAVEQETKSGENEATTKQSAEEDNENDVSSINNSNNKLVIDDDQQQKSKLENDSYLDEPSEQDVSMNNVNKNEDETQRPPQKDEASESQSDLGKGNKGNEDETAKNDDDDDHSPASLAINEENNANEEEKDTNDYESAHSNEEDANNTTSANQTSQQLITATNNCE